MKCRQTYLSHKTLGVGMALVQRVVMEQSRPFDVAVDEVAVVRGYCRFGVACRRDRSTGERPHSTHEPDIGDVVEKFRGDPSGGAVGTSRKPVLFSAWGPPLHPPSKRAVQPPSSRSHAAPP